MTNNPVPISAALAPLVVECEPETRGRPASGNAVPGRERERKRAARAQAKRRTSIAVLDMETDPFDNGTGAQVFPFVAMLYSDDFEPVTIWDEDFNSFCTRVVAAIENLPGQYTIYAHNGGKFDWMFLIHKLRGSVSFKGRGIMAAKIGRHEIRDSFHIIPEKLAAYQKKSFNYELLKKNVRNKPQNKKEILEYLESDCVYLLDVVKTFVGEHGLKLSIGQAAITAVRAAGYNVERVTEGMDAYLRHFFFGGRVECLAGKGEFNGAYKLYDVNSMYPAVMVNYQHPTGANYIVRRGEPGEHTIFLDLECVNYGAFVARGEDGETTAANGKGRFKTTIWEYRVALKYGLIEKVKIHYCVDCHSRSDFSRFVLPLYNRREEITKPKLKQLKREGKEGTHEFNDVKKDDMITKFLLNNGSGKFAQNPRRFREHFITEFGERPPEGQDYGSLPDIENEALGYAIWSRPIKRLAFNNVGTAASITGAARAVLLEAICNSVDPIYCDTDSLVCKSLGGDVDIDPSRLGAWDIEEEFIQVLIAGKKLYACRTVAGKEKIRAKGASALTWKDMQDILDDEIGSVLNVAKGPTLTKAGTQHYMTRRVRATAKPANVRLQKKLTALSRGRTWA